MRVSYRCRLILTTFTPPTVATLRMASRSNHASPRSVVSSGWCRACAVGASRSAITLGSAVRRYSRPFQKFRMLESPTHTSHGGSSSARRCEPLTEQRTGLEHPRHAGPPLLDRAADLGHPKLPRPLPPATVHTQPQRPARSCRRPARRPRPGAAAGPPTMFPAITRPGLIKPSKWGANGVSRPSMLSPPLLWIQALFLQHPSRGGNMVTPRRFQARFCGGPARRPRMRW